MPETVAHDLAGTGLRVDELQLYTRLGDGTERCRLPVRLQDLLPHDRVELSGVLVREDEADVVVVNVCVHEERALEVDAVEAVQTCAREENLVRCYFLLNLKSLCYRINEIVSLMIELSAIRKEKIN